MQRILREGNRIIRDRGLFVHKIDYSDHFSHSDSSISAINFLQYGDREWDKYAGNRYMYLNRLRHDDFIDLYESLGHNFIKIETSISERAKQELENIQLDPQFQNKSKEVLSIDSSWIVSQPKSI